MAMWRRNVLWAQTYLSQKPFFCRAKLGGRELCSKALPGEHRRILVDFSSPVSPPANTALQAQRRRAVARVTKSGPTGELHPNVLYLIELGIELKQIEDLVRTCPSLAYYSVERKIRPLVEFFLDLGMQKENIPRILIRCPQLCGIRLFETIIPTMTYLESLGMEKKKWAEVIYKCPLILAYNREKVNKVVEFLSEMGVSRESRCRILTNFPRIITQSQETGIRQRGEYFQSLGLDVAHLLNKWPHIFGLSIEHHLKPVTEFLLGKGFSEEDVRVMVTRFGSLFSFSVAKNLTPKWEFFLTLNFPRSELVKFPTYFGYSLEQRIKPRHALVKECGVNMHLTSLLSLSGSEFEIAVKKKIKIKDGKAL